MSLEFTFIEDENHDDFRGLLQIHATNSEEVKEVLEHFRLDDKFGAAESAYLGCGRRGGGQCLSCELCALPRRGCEG